VPKKVGKKAFCCRRYFWGRYPQNHDQKSKWRPRLPSFL